MRLYYIPHPKLKTSWCTSITKLSESKHSFKFIKISILDLYTPILKKKLYGAEMHGAKFHKKLKLKLLRSPISGDHSIHIQTYFFFWSYGHKTWRSVQKLWSTLNMFIKNSKSQYRPFRKVNYPLYGLLLVIK